MFEDFFKKPSLICVGYHSVRPTAGKDVSFSKIVTDAALFEKQINFIKQKGFRFISLSEIQNSSREKPKENAALIYFDDGYKDIIDFALPILERENIRAAIFLTTDFVDGTKNPWEERDAFMAWSDVLENKDKFDFGSHTVSHKKLAKLSVGEIETELSSSKKIIEKRLEREVVSLSFPHSSFDERTEKIAEEAGYRVVIGGGRGRNYKYAGLLKKLTPQELENTLS